MIGRRKKTNSWDFNGQICGKNSRFCGKFRRKIRGKFCRKTIVKKATISRQFFFFWGGGRNVERQHCAITTTTETLTTYKLKCCLLRTGDFVFKAPICFAISFGLGIVSHKVLSETLICSCNNNELRNVPVAKLFISCTGQCPVFCNNSLRTPGSFGPFSSCNEKFQDTVQLRDKRPTDTQYTYTFFALTQNC